MPRLLDLFCKAGGCAKGYQRAGFYVIGVDIEAQPRYAGDEFIQADALDVLRTLIAGDAVGGYRLEDFAAIHASPPCQAYSIANNIHGRTDHPDLIAETRVLLVAAGVPYIIENVVGAPLHNPVTICGLTLGLRVKRHRLFECTFPVMVPPCTRHEEDFLMVFGGGARRRTKQLGRTAKNGPILHRGTAPVEESRQAMGIDWMTRDELSQAIPPAYTEHIGNYLLAEINARQTLKR